MLRYNGDKSNHNEGHEAETLAPSGAYQIGPATRPTQPPSILKQTQTFSFKPYEDISAFATSNFVSNLRATSRTTRTFTGRRNDRSPKQAQVVVASSSSSSAPAVAVAEMDSGAGIENLSPSSVATIVSGELFNLSALKSTPQCLSRLQSSSSSPLSREEFANSTCECHNCRIVRPVEVEGRDKEEEEEEEVTGGQQHDSDNCLKVIKSHSQIQIQSVEESETIKKQGQREVTKGTSQSKNNNHSNKSQLPDKGRSISSLKLHNSLEVEEKRSNNNYNMQSTHSLAMQLNGQVSDSPVPSNSPLGDGSSFSAAINQQPMGGCESMSQLDPSIVASLQGGGSNGAGGGVFVGSSSKLGRLVGKKASRFKELVLQNLGKAERTHDELFSIYEENFHKQQAQAIKLQKEFKIYVTSLKGSHEANKSLNACIQQATGDYQSARHDLVCENLTQLEHLSDDLMDKLRDQIMISISEYLSQFGELRDKISKRRRKLIDYDSSRRNYEIALANITKKRMKQQQQQENGYQDQQQSTGGSMRTLKSALMLSNSLGDISIQQPNQQQQHQMSTSHLVDEARLIKMREHYNYCKIMYETINNELHEELPMIYEKKMRHLLMTLQNYFSLEAQFSSNAGKLFATISDVVDELPTMVGHLRHHHLNDNHHHQQQHLNQDHLMNDSDLDNRDHDHHHLELKSKQVDGTNQLQVVGGVVAVGPSGSSGMGSSRGESSMGSGSLVSSSSPTRDAIEVVEVHQQQQQNQQVVGVVASGRYEEENECSDQSDDDHHEDDVDVEIEVDVDDNESGDQQFQQQVAADVEGVEVSAPIEGEPSVGAQEESAKIVLAAKESERLEDGQQIAPERQQAPSLDASVSELVAELTADVAIAQVVESNEQQVLEKAEFKNGKIVRDEEMAMASGPSDGPAIANVIDEIGSSLAIGDEMDTETNPNCLYKVKTNYKYLAEDADELCFEADEVIQVIPFEEHQEQEEGWLMGIREYNGQKGLFPANFARPL